MKRKTLILSLAFVLLLPLSYFSAQVGNKLTVQQTVNLLEENNLDFEIEKLEKQVEAFRSAYTPSGAQMGTWPSTFRLSIMPLLNTIQDRGNDYQELNRDLRKELQLFNQAYQYITLQETVKVNTENVNLARRENDLVNIRVNRGVAAPNDRTQVEISVNNAIIQANDTSAQLNQLRYHINQQIGFSIEELLEIENPPFQTIPSNDLNARTVAQSMKQNHPSLIPFQTAVNSYKRALEIVERQDPLNFSVPVEGLTNYYNLEIELANLKLKRQQQIIEAQVYSYTDRIKQMENNIRLLEANVQKNETLYNGNIRVFEEGMLTSVDLENSRVNILRQKLQLTNAKGEYMQLVKEYNMFRKGYLPM